MLKRIILFLFFISGFTGLIYEIIWTRIFGLIFGNTTLAISTVLAAFMLGLAVGGRKFGKSGDHLKHNLRSYALLELGVGATALLIPALRDSLEMLFSGIHPSLQNLPFLFNLIKFLVAFTVMFPATFLMGGTLPVISHVVITQQEKIGVGFGSLYSVNTLGAVCGTFLTAFYLIYTIGVVESIFLAVLLNILIGITALMIFRFSGKMNTHEKKGRISQPILHPSHNRFILWIMALSGFAALSYEILWSRLLVFIMTNSVYAFAVMLTTFLFGIAVGSYFGGFLAKRSQNHYRILGWIEIGIGVAAFLAAFLLNILPEIHDKIMVLSEGSTWWQFNSVRLLEAFIIMFPSTFLMGIAFPLAGRILVPDLSIMSAGLGWLYFYNTIGGVFGSFLTGFILISLFGTSGTYAALVVINFSLGIILLLNRSKEVSWKNTLSTAVGALVALLLVLILIPKTIFTHVYAAVEKEYPVIDFREGLEGTATVHEIDLPMQQTKRIDVDGLNVAGTSFMLRTLQILQGNLPQFVHPTSQRVLQIGFGTGQTSHSALLHPIKNFTLVEISEDVMSLGSLHFAEINKGVLQNPRFHYTILDGKNYVKYTRDNYDVIMNDANYAVATASASLFTRDHFEYCRRKLKAGGILSTWMTIDLDPRDFNIVLKTFQSIFPYSLLWFAPNCINKQVVLMGSTEPIKINFQETEKKFSDPQIKNDLEAVNINSSYDLLDCLVLDSDGIRDISKDAPVNTDDHPILEFSTRAVRSRDMCAAQNLAKILIRRPNIRKLLVNLPSDSISERKITEKLRQHELASGQFLEGMLAFYQGRSQDAMQILLNGSRFIPNSRLASQFFMDMDVITTQLTVAADKRPADLEIQLRLIRQRISQSAFDEALKRLRALKNLYPQNPLVYYESARCYFSLLKLDSAKMDLEKSLRTNPRMSGSWYFLGEIFRRQNRFEKAVNAFQKAISIDPRIYEALNSIAAIYKLQGNYAQAIPLFHQSLDQMEYQPEVTASLADCYLQLKDYDKAVNFYQKALAMNNASPKVIFNLGNAFFLSRRYDDAERCFKDALTLDNENPEIYYNIGNLYALQKQYQRAIPLYKKAISLSKDEPDYFNNLAMCYRQTGQNREALQIFEEGIRLYPDSPLLMKNSEELKKITLIK
jgi:spermidine synthase